MSTPAEFVNYTTNYNGTLSAHTPAFKMPLNLSFLEGKSRSILISAVVSGLLTVTLTIAAYLTGAYYQPMDNSAMTGEKDCEATNGSYGKLACPSGVLVIASLVCVCLSLPLSIITLIFIDKSDSQPQRINAFLMIVVSIGMGATSLLLIFFLLWVNMVNYPCAFNDTLGGPSPHPWDAAFETCGFYTDFYYKHKLLIAAMFFAILGDGLSILCAVLLFKESKGIDMVAYGGGRKVDPSQSQVPQDQKQQP